MKSKSKKSRKPRIGKPKLRVTHGKKEVISAVERTYFRELHKIIDGVFKESADSFDWTWNQLAENAGLGYSTVAKLGDRQTRWPRFSTIWRLAKAVGWDLAIQQPKTHRKALVLHKVA